MRCSVGRLATSLAVAASVGCLGPQRAGVGPAEPAWQGATGLAGESAPMLADRVLTDPAAAGKLAEAGLGVVRIRVGGSRSVQAIPVTAQSLAIAVRDPDGRNLIDSATCGSTACYMSSVEKVLAPYSPTAPMTIAIVVRIDRLPAQPAALSVVAYRQEWMAYFDNPTAIAVGGASGLSIAAGKVATADIVLTPLGVPPVLEYAYPLMAAEGQEILVRARNLSSSSLVVDFGDKTARVVMAPRPDGTLSLPVPASASDGKFVIYNDFGGAERPFTALREIGLPATFSDLASNGKNSITVNAMATSSSGTVLPTASVEWFWDLNILMENVPESKTAPKETVEQWIPKFTFKDPLTGKTVGPTASVGMPYYPGSVGISGAKAGDYVLTIKNGRLTATGAIRVR
ncbi:MAG: hypothetical protein FJZ01_26335 [Candidatus Sericytochromatia bacterium]|nr:hypothetical protein [Candidatus Tanganyikabacteria bacterium]